MENIGKHNYPVIVKLLQNESYNRENHSDFEILLSLKGSAHLTIGPKIYDFEQNDIILINPLESYQITNMNGIIANIVIRKQRLELEDNIANSAYYCNSCEYSNKTIFLNLQKHITSLVGDFNKPNFTISKAFAYAYTIISEISTNFPPIKTNTSNQKSKMDEILDFIEQKYADNLSLNELANEFNFSIPYLSNLFKKNLNMNFTEYYDQVRLKHSLKDLLETDLPIIDIALKNGFASNHAFLRAYKQQYAELPSETRKNKKDNNFTDELYTKEEKGIDELISDLKKETENNIKENIYKDIIIRGYSEQKVLFSFEDNPTCISISVNNARNLAYEDVRKVILDAKRKLHVKYVYFCGIFSDSLYFCSRNKNGKLYFRFNLINEILDFLVSQDLIPLLSLTYMPSVLAKDKNKTIFADEYNTSPPTKIEEWNTLLNVFINHAIDRYGIEIVEKWLFIPWRQPDTEYDYMGFNTSEEFYHFYKSTYETIKKINKNFIVTSPELLPLSEKKINWFRNFINWTRENFCLPNYVCLEFYMEDNWDILETYTIKGKSFQTIPYTKPTKDQDRLNKYLSQVRSILQQNNTRIPIMITQYNFTISHYNILQDTLFLADFILKNMIDNIEKAKLFTYYKISDFEETLADINYFSGGTGLYYKNGIPKPNLHALSFLAKLEKNILSRGNNYILTANNERNHLTILVHNYEHPNEDLIGDDLFTSSIIDRYLPFVNKSKKRILLNFTTRYEKAKIQIFSVNKMHGSPYDKWLDAGKPPIDTYNRLENSVFDVIKTASYPDYKYQEKTITKDTLELELLLEPLEIKLIEIKLNK